MKNILLVGTGYMGTEYAKVLKALGVTIVPVGRSKQSVKVFEETTNLKAFAGGLGNWLKKNRPPENAIVTVPEDKLGQVTRQLINSGVKNILVEKPGGLSSHDIIQVSKNASNKKARVYVAYNRRFYASVIKARKIIRRDGGVNSFTFDFTERSHIVSNLKQSDTIKAHWFLQNSTHVIDMAFSLGGKPKTIHSDVVGKLPWHPSGSIFSGSGRTETGGLFSYHANWTSPGRWKIEIQTKNHKLLFKPLEKLQIQKLGTTTFKEIHLNDKLDKEFKPGLYLQVQSFLKDKHNLLTIKEQVKNLKYYRKICNES